MASKHFQPDTEYNPEVIESHGLTKWMRRASEEAVQLEGRLKARHVHDLRIALRRCRAIASGFEQLDPDPAWPRMGKAAKRLLNGMSGIRDIQVMRDWILALGMSGSEVGNRLSSELDDKEHRARRDARRALKAFEAKQWRKWTKALPKRAARTFPVAPTFALIALERWQQAWDLHRSAMRLRSRVSFHRLRVAIKRFRYCVESFLPTQAAEWGRELKKVQDLLGEVHDLDVLWETLLQLRPPLKTVQRKKWRKSVDLERFRRLKVYREKMTGPEALWGIWRAALPEARANPPVHARRGK